MYLFEGLNSCNCTLLRSHLSDTSRTVLSRHLPRDLFALVLCIHTNSRLDIAPFFSLTHNGVFETSDVLRLLVIGCALKRIKLEINDFVSLGRKIHQLCRDPLN